MNTSKQSITTVTFLPKAYWKHIGIVFHNCSLSGHEIMTLAPPTSARGVSNPMTTKVTMPATTTQTTAVPVSGLDVQITQRPDAEVFRQCRPATMQITSN